MSRTEIIVGAILLLFINNLISQEMVVVRKNNLTVPIFADGHIAGPEDSRYWAYLEFNEKPMLWTSGFFLSGFVNDSLWVNAAAFTERCRDYLPGGVNANEHNNQGKIFRLESHEPAFSQSWLDWSEAVENGAYYYDGNKNGKYDPIDLNGNGIWEPTEDRPDLLYDATYFNVYNDSRPASQRYIKKVKPIGIEIRQTIFLSNTVEQLKNTLFIRYSILNSGNEADTLKDVIFSIYALPEIGYLRHYDDYIGCDTTLQSGFAYNDAEDETWGQSPPSIFFTILQGPISSSETHQDTARNNLGPLLGPQVHPNRINQKMSSHTTNHRFIPNYIDDPSSDKFQLRNKIEGNSSNGAVIDPCNFTFGRVEEFDCTQVNPRFLFSGDPVQNRGWLCNHLVWQRQMTSTGLFSLIKGKPQDIIVAYTVGQGDTHLSSITDARERVRFIFEEYNNNFPNSYTPLNYEEIYPKEFMLSQNYPNPFNPSTNIKFSIPNVRTSRDLSLQAHLIVYDILGREVKTLVNDVKGPGNYEITFDASQLASGVYYYRLIAGEFSETKKFVLIK